MGALWYALLSFMLAVYVVLDGFDFGVGALHHFVARTDGERRTVLAAIGPVWDGNEVWLLASGGVLVFAFPRVYAAAASGFYLPVMLILWLLILRGIAIEFRSLVEHPLWRQFWDATFTFGSTLLALVMGVALANIVRGVPVDTHGWFHVAWFSNFRTGAQPGAIDWYTLLVGALALALLCAHGALYLAWKTEDPIQGRSRRLAWRSFVAMVVLLIAVSVATFWVQPLVGARFSTRWILWVVLAALIAAVVLEGVLLRRARDGAAFLASAGVIVALLVLCAGTLYPTLLPSTLGPERALEVANTASARRGLLLGLIWWLPAIALAIVYFVYLFRSFRGKVTGPEHH